MASSDECGLLFLCAQSDIARQFEFHQAKMANGNLGKAKADFLREPLQGPDHVAAHPRPVEDKLAYDDGLSRYERYAATIDIDVRIYDAVELRGSEYLFAPSLSGLKALVGGGAP